MPVRVINNIPAINLKPNHRRFVLKMLKLAPIADFHGSSPVVKMLQKTLSQLIFICKIFIENYLYIFVI